MYHPIVKEQVLPGQLEGHPDKPLFYPNTPQCQPKIPPIFAQTFLSVDFANAPDIGIPSPAEGPPPKSLFFDVAAKRLSARILRPACLEVAQREQRRETRDPLLPRPPSPNLNIQVCSKSDLPART